ncbi:MAG TPA: hypothetical protein VGN97_03170 [Mesorhizobium sp.]|nr:hypothetical protein [Mesorhizobium sp.]
MSKLLIALGLVAALSAPAAAGRLDVDLNAADGVAQIEQGINITGTRSIAPEQGQDTSAAERNSSLFGANSR